MNAILEEIYQTGCVRDGDEQPVHWAPIGTSELTGRMLHHAITTRKLGRTLESGMAYGLSTLFICEAHRDNGQGTHIAVDPHERTKWRSIGVLNLKRAGLTEYCRVIEERADEALPALARDGVQLDFAYIDGQHLFDYALVDFFYIDQMLRPGGLVAIDDLWMPAIRRLVNFVLSNRNYKRAELGYQIPAGARWVRPAGRMIRAFGEHDPHAVRRMPGNAVFLEKGGEDARDWDYYRRF